MYRAFTFALSRSAVEMPGPGFVFNIGKTGTRTKYNISDGEGLGLSWLYQLAVPAMWGL